MMFAKPNVALVELVELLLGPRRAVVADRRVAVRARVQGSLQS